MQRVGLTTPTSSSSSESSKLAALLGGELRIEAAASFEFSFSTPNACGRSTSCSNDVDADIVYCVYLPEDVEGGGRWWWFEGESLGVPILLARDTFI